MYGRVFSQVCLGVAGTAANADVDPDFRGHSSVRIPE